MITNDELRARLDRERLPDCFGYGRLEPGPVCSRDCYRDKWCYELFLKDHPEIEPIAVPENWTR